MRLRLLLLALPGAIVLAAAKLALIYVPDATLQLNVSSGLSYTVSAAALLLAWRLRQVRIFAAAFLLVVLSAVLHGRVLGGVAIVQILFATFLPLGLALIALRKDEGFTPARCRNQTLLALAPLAVATFLSIGSQPAALQLLTTNIVDPVYTDWSGLPQLALIGVAVTLGVLAARTALAPRPAHAGLFFLTIAMASALAAPHASVARTIWTLAGGLGLIAALVETAYRLAFYDELTELPGRRALANALQSLQPPYAAAIVDVDHFKNFNDQYGHDVGDQVLRMVAARMRAIAAGTAYRSGGEEFTILFPGIEKRDALQHVEALRIAVADARFALRKLPRPRGKQASAARGRAHAARTELQVTISVGVAGPGARYKTVDAVLRQADKSMYRAKHEGRNRVIA